MTKHRNSGLSRHDEILTKLLRAVSEDMTTSDFHLLMRSFSLANTDILEIEALHAPFRKLLDCFYVVVGELAEADLAANRRVQYSHPAFISREQRLAMARLSALIAFNKVKEAYFEMLPVQDKARATIRGRIVPQSVTTAVVLTTLQAVDTLCRVVRTFCLSRWSNIMASKSEDEINQLLAPIHYFYHGQAANSPALYMNDESGDVQMVNLGDLAGGYRTKSGHFLVRRKIESSAPGFYDEDWVLTANPGNSEVIYRGDDFIASNRSLNMDRHRSPAGFECNEQIRQEFNRPHQSMVYWRWKLAQNSEAK